MRGMGVVAGALLGWALACGGGHSSPPPAPQVVSVALSPSGASLWTNGTQAFQATVSGTTNTAVTWSVGEAAGGTISAAGLYTAPGSAGNFHVKATSVADATKTAEAPVTVSVQPPPGACNGADLGAGANLNGFLPFPSDNAWNQDVSTAPVDPNSGAIIGFIGNAGLHPDFGAGLWQGSPIGIPYVVVASSTQAKVPVVNTAWPDESDPGPMPIPFNAPVEGTAVPGDNTTVGDRHVLIMDRDTCLLYELGNGHRQADGSWTANCAATWDLKSNALRPYGWTSTDAAGLPIFPGLARYDEVAAGAINHALRFTVPTTRKAYVLPATHQAGGSTSASAPPMGLRVRLKASVDISGYPAQARIVLTALKRYGMIVADNGSAWYISGAPDVRWNNDQLATLSGVKGSDFEVVQMGTVYTSAPTGTAPGITSFAAIPASTTASAGTQLGWSTTNATRWFITPDIGWVTGTSVAVKPAATTTYILQAENAYGSATRTVQVVVTP
jgi:hypothetical protein